MAPWYDGSGNQAMAMFTPGHDGATMFTETWRHAPGHCSVQPSVTA